MVVCFYEGDGLIWIKALKKKEITQITAGSCFKEKPGAAFMLLNVQHLSVMFKAVPELLCDEGL